IFQNSPGIPITASYVINNAQIRDAIGRNLAACPSQTIATCTATVRTELIPPNTMFEPRLTQVDLRVSRLFRLAGTTRLRGSLDIYNIFNASSVLSMTPTYGQSWLNAEDGKPNLNGIWQAMTTANWDIEAHNADAGPHPQIMGAWGAEPAGMGIVEGGTIPYKPDALKKKQENFKNRMLVKVTNDPHRF